MCAHRPCLIIPEDFLRLVLLKLIYNEDTVFCGLSSHAEMLFVKSGAAVELDNLTTTTIYVYTMQQKPFWDIL